MNELEYISELKKSMSRLNDDQLKQLLAFGKMLLEQQDAEMARIRSEVEGKKGKDVDGGKG